MSLLPSMIQIIKQAAIEAMEASNPMRLMYGTVTSANPLAVKIDQKFTVPASLLVLTGNVAKHKVTITIDEEEKEITVDNSLASGDRVILMQEQGGQRYIVLDKVGV